MGCDWLGVSLLGGCFFSLYGCSDRTRVSGVFLRELALDPLMTFDQLDLTSVLLPLGTVAGTVGVDRTTGR